MSIYSGFPTRKDEQKYNSLLSKLLLALQTHLLELIGDTITQQKIKNYAKIITKMRDYEEHKYLPPKFTDLLQPLCQAIGLETVQPQRLALPEPQAQQRFPINDKYKLSSRSLHKHKFNPALLGSYESYNGKEKRLENIQEKHLHTEGNLKKHLIQSSSKLSKPKVCKGIFPIDHRKIELSEQYEQPLEIPEHWQTFNKSKISRQGLPPKLSNFRYKAYQALQQAQSSINKRNVPLREQMRRKLKTQGGQGSENDL